MKAKFTRAEDNRLGIWFRFEPEIFEEQLLLEQFTRDSQGFTFSFSGWEHNSSRAMREGLTSVWGQLVKGEEPLELAVKKLKEAVSFAMRVASRTKHGPGGGGDRGSCEVDCLKCQAEQFLDENKAK